MKSIVVTEYGSSDTLEVRETEKPEPGPGEVRLAVEAAGINFADIMQRRGHYRNGPTPTYTPGLEAAGTIDAVGEGVDREVGERVVAMTGGGAYAEYVTTRAAGLFDVPESMSFAEAAGFPVQFLTAYNCLHEWGGFEDGERVLIHAAAGGVGTAAVQLASLAGAETFGTASTEEKLDLATDLGLDHPIQYTEVDFRDVVDAETDGEGVDLVLDGVGGETFQHSLDALSDFGRIVTYGVASGEVAKADTRRLLFENKSVIGFHLGNALQKRPQSVLGAVPELSELLASGELEVVVGERFDLEDAAAAQQYIEDRKSSGKVVLEP
ncbi:MULTISPECIES: NADPH:quinone oxidoreductase family protein [Haloferax]|uniref:Zinc-binding dehydrogenase n=1 Tax=Haloferax marinum TaxID=2666143 RepID=A0A6A8G570_9EURY|nr:MULTISPECIES: NADPH:quinone oxidoreductase family protein [Haloferax]KAB1196734.1 NADPH:quinone oxidoreductase family protein [Haloferax sp. CBA1150]MRW95742.1 zinc-binding dehydrogenase [Haloferax marinum]